MSNINGMWTSLCGFLSGFSLKGNSPLQSGQSISISVSGESGPLNKLRDRMGYLCFSQVMKSESWGRNQGFIGDHLLFGTTLCLGQIKWKKIFTKSHDIRMSELVLKCEKNTCLQNTTSPQQILNLWNSKGIKLFFLSVEPQEHNDQSHSLLRSTVFSLVHTWFLVVLRSFGTYYISHG